MTNPGDLAFSTDALHAYTNGLTKREYFAAMAMQGFLSAKLNDDRGNISIEVLTAKAAIVMADALIAELNKEPKNET